MRILLSFLQDTTVDPYPVPAYRFWSYYIKNGIREAGMHYMEIPGTDWAEGLMYTLGTAENKAWKDKNWSLTTNFVRSNKHKIDIFLCYLNPHQIEMSAIAEIERLGVPCVNFYCDNIREFNKVPNEFKAFSRIWVPELEALPMYKKAGVNFTHLPMPMWVENQFRQIGKLKEATQVSFIGSKDLLREQLLQEVITKGLKVAIRGSGWKDEKINIHQGPVNDGYKMLQNQIQFIREKGFSGWFIKALQKFNGVEPVIIDQEYIFPPPDFDQYRALTKSSMVTLGINRVPSFKRLAHHPLVYSRLRDIEAPMLGACYLTEYCAGVKELYDLENDIWTYKNADELVIKVKELITHPGKRHQLRLNGQFSALKNLSLPGSLAKLRSVIFG